MKRTIPDSEERLQLQAVAAAYCEVAVHGGRPGKGQSVYLDLAKAERYDLSPFLNTDLAVGAYVGYQMNWTRGPAISKRRFLAPSEDFPAYWIVFVPEPDFHAEQQASMAGGFDERRKAHVSAAARPAKAGHAQPPEPTSPFVVRFGLERIQRPFGHFNQLLRRMEATTCPPVIWYAVAHSPTYMPPEPVAKASKR